MLSFSLLLAYMLAHTLVPSPSSSPVLSSFLPFFFGAISFYHPCSVSSSSFFFLRSNTKLFWLSKTPAFLTLFRVNNTPRLLLILQRTNNPYIPPRVQLNPHFTLSHHSALIPPFVHTIQECNNNRFFVSSWMVRATAIHI